MINKVKCDSPINRGIEIFEKSWKMGSTFPCKMKGGRGGGGGGGGPGRGGAAGGGGGMGGSPYSGELPIMGEGYCFSLFH